MTDVEFEVLDQIYFVTAFDEIVENLSFSEVQVRDILNEMLEKDWVRVYYDGENEVLSKDIDMTNKYQSYCFLASKKGLFAHNSK